MKSNKQKAKEKIISKMKLLTNLKQKLNHVKDDVYIPYEDLTKNNYEVNDFREIPLNGKIKTVVQIIDLPANGCKKPVYI